MYEVFLILHATTLSILLHRYHRFHEPDICLIYHLMFLGLQQIENPCPRVKHPVWLQRNMNEKVRIRT